MKKAIKANTKLHRQDIIVHDQVDSLRLNKYISDSGYCSRREADRLIENGSVKINGQVALLGTKVFPKDVVSVNGTKINLTNKTVYIMLYKPTGITCTNDTRVRGNIRDFVDYHELIFPIGRLDKDSSGLILLTNDGDIVNKILRAENGHEKEYVVTVDKDITPEFVKHLEEGVTIFNQVANKNQITAPTKIVPTDKRTFKITLKQGLNRQIRRMTETQGYIVKSLKRIRIINLKLGSLKVGQWRYLTDEELIQLNKDIN